MDEYQKGTATREMGDDLNCADLSGGRWEMVGVIGRREAGDRLATLRETRDGRSIQNHPISQREMGDSDPLLSPLSDR